MSPLVAICSFACVMASSEMSGCTPSEVEVASAEDEGGRFDFNPCTISRDGRSLSGCNGLRSAARHQGPGYPGAT